MRLFLFFLLVTSCSSADYIWLKSAKKLEGTSVTLGPGFFYTTAEYQKLLGEIAGYKHKIEILEVKNDYQEKIIEMYEKNKSKDDYYFNQLKELYNERISYQQEKDKNAEELMSIYKKEINTLKVKNKLMSWENRLTKMVFTVGGLLILTR